MTTAAQQFAGTVGQRVEGLRVDVLDADLNELGVLAVSRDQVPTIVNDVNRNIARTIEGLQVPARPRGDQNTSRYYAEDLDTLTMRIAPYWLLGTGEEYELGKFLFGDDSATVWSWGSPRELMGVDQMVLLDHDLDAAVGYPAGTIISDALIEQADLENIGAPRRNIEVTRQALSEPIGFAPGRDTRRRVVESLCALAGYLPPYFSNAGLLTCISAPDLAAASPAFKYGYGVGAVIDGSIVTSNDLLNAPNRYIVIDSAARDTPITGTFDVPDAAPHSYANTHRRITRTVTLQALGDVAAANAAAAAVYQSESATYSWLQFSTPIDPRHDTFDVISFDNVNYRQLQWSIECVAGGRMEHDARGTYS